MKPYTIFFSLAFVFFIIAFATKFFKFGKSKKEKKGKEENVNRYGNGKGYILLDDEKDLAKNSGPDSWIPMIKVDDEEKKETQ